MKKIHLFMGSIFLFLIIISCQTVVLDDADMVSWDEHYREKSRVGDKGPGTLVIGAGSSDVRVASLVYSPENTEVRMADIYYPRAMDLHEARGAVIIVSGDTDNHAKDYYGRTLKDTDQYMQWGQVIAEEGLIAVTYELGNPQAALENLMTWIVENQKYLGIDTQKIGFFSSNENGCSVGLETIIKDSTKYTGPKPIFSIYYYGLMPLRSKELFTDIPILTVQTKDLWDRGLPASMEEFNQRAIADGAMIKALYYPEGSHYFDCREDTPRTREILEETVHFMKDNMEN